MAGGWLLEADSSGSEGDVQFNIAYNPGDWLSPAPASTSSFSGKWVYAVEVYNGSNLVCYTNGVLMATAAVPVGYETEGIYGTHKLPFVIGSYSSPGGASGGYNGGGTLANGFERGNFWHGGVSHVAIYSYALTAGQISNHYASGAKPSSATNTPAITTQPASQTNYVTQTAAFTVSAAGLAPLSYQWRVENNGVYANLSAGGQFSAVTNTTLTISGLVATNATNYDVVVTNSAGSVTSAPAMLTVLNAAPSIIPQPANQTNTVAQTATFTVSAAGLGPLSYQWQVETNGVYANLSAGGQFFGVTNATLAISNLVLGNATNYDVVVTNASGSITSAPAALTVLTNLPYQTVILGDGPVSYWPMQETTGPTIYDVVTTNAGPFNGTVQISTDGFSSGAVNAEGINNGILHETFTNSTSAV